MKIKIDAFSGIRPRVSPRLLGNEEATIAVNCRLYNGKLVAFREPERVAEGAIGTAMMVTQVGVDVVSYGLYLHVMQVGADVVSQAQPALQVTQAGADVVSA